MTSTARAALFVFFALAVQPLPARASPQTSRRPRNSQGASCGTAAPTAPVAQPHLDYCGGRILSQAQIVAVLWGTPDPLAPTPSCSGTFQSCIDGWYQAFIQSPQFNWLDEYQTTGTAFDGDAGTGQHIMAPSYYGSVVINPANTATTVGEIEIENEIVAQISSGNLPAPDLADETIYEVHFPLEVDPSDTCSVACQDFCAYHDSWHSNILNTTGIIAIIPSHMPPGYSGGRDCSLCGDRSDWFANLGGSMSHETIESITDPDVGLASGVVDCASPVGWYDSNPLDSMSVHGEIGDMCEGVPDGSDRVTQVSFAQADGGVFTVQREWSNQFSACVGGHDDAFSVSGPAGTLLGNPGGSVSFPIATSAPVDAGAPLPVHLLAHGLPASGVTAAFVPSNLDASGTSMLTLAIDAAAPQTQFTLGITADSGDTLGETVLNISAPDFSGTIAPSSISLTAGGPASAPLTLTTQLISGSARGFTLAINGAEGVTVTPSAGNLGTPLAFTLSAAAGAPSVNGTLSINVTSGGVLHTFPVALTLAGDDASLSAPAGLTVAQGSSVQFKLSSTTRAGNPQLLALTAINLPAGATAAFNPAEITSGQSSTATVSVTDTQPLAPISITIDGAGPYAQTTVNVPITVVAPSGCSEPGPLPFALLGLFGLLRKKRALLPG